MVELDCAQVLGFATASSTDRQLAIFLRQLLGRGAHVQLSGDYVRDQAGSVFGRKLRLGDLAVLTAVSISSAGFVEVGDDGGLFGGRSTANGISLIRACDRSHCPMRTRIRRLGKERDVCF